MKLRNYSRIFCNCIPWIVSVWVLFLPHPYYLSILVTAACIPLIFLYASLNRNSYELTEPKISDEISINLAFPLLPIASSLAIRAWIDAHFFNGWEVAIRIIPTGLVFFALMRLIVKKCEISITLFVAVLNATAFIILLNDSGSGSQPTISQGHITSKNSGTKQPSTFDISVGIETKRVQVGKTEYKNYDVGNAVCIKEDSGLLGIRNRFLSPCSPS
jgi:hypothetical protein